MEIVNKKTQNPSIPQPLPPPPPPLPPKSDKPMEICPQNYQQLDAHEEVIRALKRAAVDLNDPTKTLLSFYQQVTPVIQDGPMCGLVALKMASQLLSCDQLSIESILATAKDLKFTKFGEMFSAEDMGTLAEKLLHCKKQIVSDVLCYKNNILKHILEGWPVLFPYDSDKNHEPCCKKGHSAHWATISGICIIVPHNVSTQDNLQQNVRFCHFSNGHEMLKFLDDAESIYVYAHEGKSRFLAAWNLNSLLSSNLNLIEASEKCKNSEMVLPSNFELHGLQNKAVLLSL